MKRIFALIVLLALAVPAQATRDSTRSDTTVLQASKVLIGRASSLIDAMNVNTDSLTVNTFSTINATQTFAPEKTSFSRQDSTYTGYSADIVRSYVLSEVVWDVAAFQEAVARSSISTRGDTTAAFPTNFALVAAKESAIDSIGIIDTDTGEQYIWFTMGGASSGDRNWMGIVGGSATEVNDIAFLDGCLYVGLSNSAFGKVDFVRDDGRYWDATNGLNDFIGTISQRNSGGGTSVLNASPKLVSNAVNAIAAIRDPEGGVDEFGRPLHVVGVVTAGGTSISDAGIENWYDHSNAQATAKITGFGDGWFLQYGRDNATRDFADAILAPVISADGWVATGSMIWVNTDVGGMDITMGDAAVASAVGMIPQQSVVTTGAFVAFLGNDLGLVISHVSHADGEEKNTLTWEIDATQNAPPWSGVVGMSLPLEDATEMFGNDLTNNNSVTFVNTATTSVIGAASDFVAASSMSLTDADVAAHTPSLTAGSYGCWFRREIDSGSPEGLMSKWDLNDGNDEAWKLDLTSSDEIRGSIRVTGPAETTSTGPAISLNTWYHAVMTWDGTTQKLYLDGVEVDSDARSGTQFDPTEPIVVGAGTDTGAATRFFDGQIDQVFVLGRALSAKEVAFLHARGRSALQNNAVGDDALTGASVQKIATYEDGASLVLAGASTSADSTLHLLDKYGIILDTLTVSGAVDVSIPAGGMRGIVPDTTLESRPWSLALGTGGHRVNAPDPVIENLIQGPPVVYITEGGSPYDAIVDSSGTYQLYWQRGMAPGYYNFQDAHDAVTDGAWIFGRYGTYPPLNISKNVRITGQNQRGVVASTARSTLIDGGTTDDAIDVTATGDYSVIEYLSVQTTAGGGNAFDGIEIATNANYVTVQNCFFVASDNNHIDTESIFGTFTGNIFNSADGSGMNVDARDQIIIGNHFPGTMGGNHMTVTTNGVQVIIEANDFDGAAIDGINNEGRRTIISNNTFGAAFSSNCVQVGNSGDQSAVHGNIMEDTGTCIDIATNAENCSIAPNVLNGTVSDASGTSTADGSNEIY